MEAISPQALPITPNLLALLKNDAMWDEVIDVFYTMFHEYALTLKNGKNKQQIENSLTFLDKLKTLEWEENIKNEKDIKDLENMLQNI